MYTQSIHHTPHDVLESILKDPEIEPGVKIRRLLGLRGETIRDLARNVGRAEITLYKNLSGERESARLRLDIASYLGVEVSDLWPCET